MAKRVKLNDEFRWANPTLKEQLRSDPAAVLAGRGLHVPATMPTAIVHEFVRVTHLLWVDGVITPIDQFRIDPADEGLLFGRGLWESTRTIAGEPWLWNEHLQRLRQTAELLTIAVDFQQLPTTEQVRDYVRGLTTQDVVVRLNVTAGRPGQRGVMWLSAAPLPYYPPSLRLQTVANPVHKGQAYLTLKTFQYATRLRLNQQASKAGYDGALLYDDQGHITEAAHANVFVHLADGWVTPTADGGLLPGTVRHVLLTAAPFTIREQKIPKAMLRNTRELFVTNSHVGIVPITQVDELTFPVGTETQALQRWLEPPQPPGPRYHFVQRKSPPR